MYARAAKVYQQVDLESASKSKILDRLYLRFLRDCEEAKSAIRDGDLQTKTNSINHGNRILMELLAALDHTLAPDLCGNLAALYDYAIDRLMQANLTNSEEFVEQAGSVVIQLREAFLEADRVNG